MAYSKRQIVLAAFEELGLASYAFDLQPDQLESALRRLDSMIAEWNGRGVSLPYPLPSSPQNSDIDTDAGIPDWAIDAVITNLAIKIAPGYGKQVMPDTRIAAKNSYDVVVKKSVSAQEVQPSASIPLGAGNKHWRRGGGTVIRQQAEALQAEQGEELEF